MSLRKKVIGLLAESKFQELIEIAGDKHGIFRILILLTYDKEQLLCWRAIETIGLIAGEIAKSDPEAVRRLSERFLWMLRDESGNNPGSAPEILGEILRNTPDELSDIAPVIMSFHDEEMLRCGVFRAAVRISEKRPDLVNSSAPLIKQYLKDDNALVRVYAVMLAGNLGLKEYISDIRALLNDNNFVRFYKDGDFQQFTVGKIAGQNVKILT